MMQRAMPRKAKQKEVAMLVGAILLVAALLLLVHNRNQDIRAGDSSQRVLARIRPLIIERQSGELSSKPAENHEKRDLGPSEPLPENLAAKSDPASDMPVIEIDGFAYIGYLSIQALDLELPVLSACDLEGLNIGSCRQFGSIRSYDMTIAGHNYSNHFGRLHLLQTGDRVLFTDVEGQTTSFVVCAKEVLAATAVEKVRNSGWDLTLYTCTYGGHQRLLVGCRAESK